MSDIIQGIDSQSMSTPVTIRRGSAVTLRRQIKTLNRDTLQESSLNIGSATSIEWQVVKDLSSGASYVLRKALGAGITLISSGTSGQYDIVLSAASTKGLSPGLYYASIAVSFATGRFKFAPYRFVILAAPKSDE